MATTSPTTRHVARKPLERVPELDSSQLPPRGHSFNTSSQVRISWKPFKPRGFTPEWLGILLDPGAMRNMERINVIDFEKSRQKLQ